MSVKAVTVTARKRAELKRVEGPAKLGRREVRGRTLATLVSPGTELAHNFLGERFPSYPGYAAVFEVERVGGDVTSVSRGDRCFCMGGHRSVQQVEDHMMVRVPDGLDPQVAVVARLMGVSMSTLIKTAARPGDRVLIIGAGPVGYLAAHMFVRSGYNVTVIELDERRRGILTDSGLGAALESVPTKDPHYAGRVALAIDTSGHEAAVLDACRVMRRNGEVVLVGVPWVRRTTLAMHELLWEVFHRCIRLESGWESRLPMHSNDSEPHSMFSGFRLALAWLAEGRIPLDGLVQRHKPDAAQTLYEDLLAQCAKGLFHVFDW